MVATILSQKIFWSYRNFDQNMDLKIFYWQIFGGAASKHIGLPVCLSIRLFQLASVEVSLTILMSNIVGEYRRVFCNYLGTKNEQYQTQTVYFG